jgi:hypothetical protein
LLYPGVALRHETETRPNRRAIIGGWGITELKTNSVMNENNNTRKEQQEDDGSLSFLAIPQDEGNKHFNCRETTQQKLINLTFWVCDFIEGVKTKFGAERFLVKIKKNRDDKDSEAEKFFTNSSEIKYVLKEIKKRNAFPRRVTMRASGTRYYFE